MIQIDMQMPERCGVCFAMHTDEIGLESWCGIDETARDIYTEEINTKRPDWCPLKEREVQKVCNMERRMYGQWERFTDEPETEAGKADYVSAAVEKLLHRFVGHGVIPDWGTIQIIIKEGCDIFSGPDWYEDEKKDYKGPYVGWAMTVGIKFYSENYQE